MRDISEAQTRKDLIDPAIARAGWDLCDKTQVDIEIPVDGYDTEPWNGVTDYILKQPNGETIAVIEAKRQSRDPLVAEQQVKHYITEIEKQQSFRPFAFLTNGHEIYFWDQAGGEVKRRVHGFFSPDDLQRLKYLREHKKPLADTLISSTITDRVYQHEAIRRVCESFEIDRRRKALLVMATGTGKTRTAMSIVDVFMRSDQAQNILFVADRNALVRQALEDGFKQFLPDEPAAWVKTHNVEEVQASRLLVGTLQTLSRCFERFTPAFFDLIIFDEVHRSIFNKFYEIIEYFDARMIGLTATPAAFIDRNTFQVFQRHDGTPTFLYTYEDAIEDGYLVDYDLYVAQTRFQRAGIKGLELSEEDRNELIQQGLDPDDIDYSGSELETKVSNRDTIRRQWEEFWEVCLKDESGQLPGKTIVFAMTQQHAFRLKDVFDEMYPQYPELAKVITHETNYRSQLIDDFKKKDQPRIAISVDMLDTGVDVPECVNLVFMKPVHSYIKLHQMIGRGTRSNATCRHPAWLPGGEKTRFLIIDFWENDFGKEADADIVQALPVLVSIFNIRLQLLELHLHDQQSEECRRIVADLRGQIAEIPREAFSVKKVFHEVREAWEDAFWVHLTPNKIDFLRLKVGPLLRFVPGVDVPGATFTNKVERLKLEIATGKPAMRSAGTIAEDVSRLPNFVREQSPAKADLIDLALSAELPKIGLSRLNALIDELASEMKNKRKEINPFLELDLPDYTETRGYIWLVERNEQVYVEEYRRRVEARIMTLVNEHPTIQAIADGAPVSDEQLIALERALQNELRRGEMELSEENIRKAYNLKIGSLLGFLRYILEMDALPDYNEVVTRQFEQFMVANRFNANQLRFLRALQSVFLQKRRLELADLYEAPALVAFGADVVDQWFNEAEIDAVLDFTQTLAV